MKEQTHSVKRKEIYKVSGISPRAAKELYQILYFLPEENIKNIPCEEMEYIEKIQDNNYNTCINSIEDINSNNIMEETQKYLAYIFFKYLSTEEEKIEYEIIIKENEKRYQKELTEKYDISKIFAKNDEKIDKIETQMVVTQKKNIFEIILEQLRKILKR